MTEEERRVKSELLVVRAQRSWSQEIRSAVAWVAFIVATVAWAFGFVNPKQAIASMMAATLIGLSAYQPTPRDRG